MRALSIVTMSMALLWAAAASAAPHRWPPVKGPGDVFVHIGEEHLDDPDGATIFPRVIADSILFKPDLVVAAGDKTSNGTEENLLSWKNAMAAYDRAGVPYFAGVGNHDRAAMPGFPNGISPLSPLGPYLTTFADRPYPFGDAAPISDPKFAPATRPASDPAGASSHYWFDYGNTRWILLDNSCYEFMICDRSQNPAFTDGQTSFGFLTQAAQEAKKAGKVVLVSLHMPTQDPRPEHSQPTPLPHTFGEGSSSENTTFEDTAAAAGVDAVLPAHIKGQWQYDAQKVHYYIDGGAGGAVYVGDNEQVGVDYGYWHGFRLLRVEGTKIVTDTVPVFVPGGITVAQPAPAKRGAVVQMTATGAQPTKNGPSLDKLELRSPDPKRPNIANLPEPARIWTTGNRLVARPVAVKNDDARRNPRTQTKGGAFRAACPGRAKITITSGVESASKVLTVGSAPGKIVRSITGSAGRVRVKLAQPAVVEVARRKGNRWKTTRRSCATKGLSASVPAGSRVRVTVRSDRKPVRRVVGA
ncbi:MAG: metallophosphoesterase family protein [Solirubrobacteraceae bacterium]